MTDLTNTWMWAALSEASCWKHCVHGAWNFCPACHVYSPPRTLGTLVETTPPSSDAIPICLSCEVSRIPCLFRVQFACVALTSRGRWQSISRSFVEALRLKNGMLDPCWASELAWAIEASRVNCLWGICLEICRCFWRVQVSSTCSTPNMQLILELKVYMSVG